MDSKKVVKSFEGLSVDGFGSQISSTASDLEILLDAGYGLDNDLMVCLAKATVDDSYVRLYLVSKRVGGEIKKVDEPLYFNVWVKDFDKRSGLSITVSLNMCKLEEKEIEALFGMLKDAVNVGLEFPDNKVPQKYKKEIEMRTTGVKATGILCPIVKSGDDIVEIVSDAVLNANKNGGVSLGDGDIIGVTESVVARAQGNYVAVDDVAKEAQRVLPGDELTILNPIFSRNRFSLILKGLARAYKKIELVLGDPRDEVGNVCKNHPFTGLNYDEFYASVCEAEGCEVSIASTFSYRNILVASIHDRHQVVQCFKDKRSFSFDTIATLSDLCTKPTSLGGYNEEYGLLGSNKATEETLKLFPRQAEHYAYAIRQAIYAKTSIGTEVLVYGDGAFKDPVGKIWELADPVVSPGYTSGLKGTPNEIKMKYIADTTLNDVSGDDAVKAMKECIVNKEDDLVGNMTAQGTTPRQYTDLLGSLCDLVSGSGDKGTPVVVVQGYFDNYATE